MVQNTASIWGDLVLFMRRKNSTHRYVTKFSPKVRVGIFPVSFFNDVIQASGARQQGWPYRWEILLWPCTRESSLRWSRRTGARRGKRPREPQEAALTFHRSGNSTEPPTRPATSLSSWPPHHQDPASQKITKYPLHRTVGGAARCLFIYLFIIYLFSIAGWLKAHDTMSMTSDTEQHR